MGARRKRGWGGARKGGGRPREMTNPVKITVMVEKRDVRALRQLAEKTGVRFAAYVRRMVREHVVRHR